MLPSSPALANMGTYLRRVSKAHTANTYATLYTNPAMVTKNGNEIMFKKTKRIPAIITFGLTAIVSACVVVPVTDVSYVGRCGVSPDHKILKIVDVSKATNSYYSISGLVLTPILLPTTAIISGIYVLTNNAYYSGKNIVQC